MNAVTHTQAALVSLVLSARAITCFVLLWASQLIRQDGTGTRMGVLAALPPQPFTCARQAEHDQRLRIRAHCSVPLLPAGSVLDWRAALAQTLVLASADSCCGTSRVVTRFFGR
jgi:hypothetical protein